MLAGKPPHSKRVSSAGGPARGSDTARLDRGLASLCALQFHQMPWSMEALLPADLPPTSVATRVAFKALKHTVCRSHLLQNL
jgi:hypothetical protein